MHIIVGIDPGKTSAVVCLDLNGRLVHSSHMANAGIEWMVRTVREVGVPSIIATDKSAGTEVARKLNGYFNSRLYRPQNDITTDEKLAASHESSLKDRHERDAYSAALSAFRAYKNKLMQAEHIAKEKKVADIDAIKAKVIDRYSIDEAINNKKANRR